VSLDKTPPAITLTAPADGASVTSDTVEVSGSVSDANAITEILVNGAAVSVGANFSTPVPLTVGSNTIQVEAMDVAGNQTTVSRTVTRLAPLAVSILNRRLARDGGVDVRAVSDANATVSMNGRGDRGHDLLGGGSAAPGRLEHLTATATRGADGDCAGHDRSRSAGHPIRPILDRRAR
jgi:hypothetical protein